VRTVYPSLDSLLADGRVDAVVNLTAAFSHATVTRSALEAGKHVHTEKPLALGHAEAQELVELAARRGLTPSCAPATLMGEAPQTAWKLLREGAIGTVRVVYAESNWGRVESWHPAPATLHSVGAIVDVGIYPLTLVTAVFGPARRVVAWGRALVELRDAAAEGREPRASPRHAAHVVEALEAIDRSRRERRPVDVTSDFDPPAPMEWAR